MGNNSKLCVRGFCFENENEYNRAVLEEKKIIAIEQKIDTNNLQAVYLLYKKSISNNIFSTPVGYEFLYQLQKRLEANQMIVLPKDAITISNEIIEDKYQLEELTLEIDQLQKKNANLKDEMKKTILKYGKQVQSLYIVIGVLVVTIIALFLITLKSKNPNILNYEKVITNKYASWEQELSDREATIREKEIELNLLVE